MPKLDFLQEFSKNEVKFGDQIYENGRTYEIVQCEWCHKPIKKRIDSFERTDNSFCSRWCESRYKSSEDIVPITHSQHGFKWYYLRERVWNRDNETCQHCGKPRGVLERKPEVVVIDEEKELSMENLVSLCISCASNLVTLESRKTAKTSEVTENISLYHCPHENCIGSDPDSWFETERAMKIHYSTAHNGSLAKTDYECIDCSKTFKSYGKQKRCRECKLEHSDYNTGVCPSCNEEYLSLGVHWSVSSKCEYPHITDKQIDILTGMLLGDVTVQKHSNNHTYSRIQWSMISEEFLKWLDSQLGILTLGSYTLQRTPEEAAENAVNSGLTSTASAEDYNAIYSNMTRARPEFKRFSNWYDSSGNKQFPLGDIDLTPLTLKVWYVCDGTLNKSNPRPRVRITAVNESENIKELAQFVQEETGIETTTIEGCKVVFDTEETEEFFEYIGDPLPGFEYKWPEKYRG